MLVFCGLQLFDAGPEGLLQKKENIFFGSVIDPPTTTFEMYKVLLGLPFNKIFFPILVKLRFFSATINHNYEEIIFPGSECVFYHCIACTE